MTPEINAPNGSDDKNDRFLLGDDTRLADNDGLSAKSRRRLARAKSDNTLKAYGADWRDFVDWCAFHEEISLPAAPETIVNYVNDLADNAKANTVARRITAISENHIAAGYDRETNPAKSGLVRAAISSIRREKGTFQHGKSPILIETLELLAHEFRGKDDPVSLRDKAVLWLGFAGAFRRSELAAVQIEDLTFTTQGLIVFIPRSKGDQSGKGSTIAIPYAPDKELCPVRAVRAWLDVVGQKDGSLFHPFKKNGALRDCALSDKSVALIVKKYIKAIGLDEADFAGHSLRRGFATSAAQHDVDTLGIMKQTRHKSEKMVHRYIEEGKLFTDNPLDNMYNRQR